MVSTAFVAVMVRSHRVALCDHLGARDWMLVGVKGSFKPFFERDASTSLKELKDRIFYAWCTAYTEDDFSRDV